MAYKAPPNRLAKHVTNLINGNLIKQEPVWLAALKQIPVGPSIIRSQDPKVNISAISNVEKELMPEKKQAIRHKQKHLRSRPPRPRPIVYPEDKLRREFYKDHPFELSRPTCLVENESGLNRTDFSQLLLPGMHPSEVDGEAVIKYQLHLMSHEKLSKSEAYAKATAEFYDIRAQEEEEERKAKEEMYKLMEMAPRKKYTAKALQLEEQAIKKGMIIQTSTFK